MTAVKPISYGFSLCVLCFVQRFISFESCLASAFAFVINHACEEAKALYAAILIRPNQTTFSYPSEFTTHLTKMGQIKGHHAQRPLPSFWGRATACMLEFED